MNSKDEQISGKYESQSGGAQGRQQEDVAQEPGDDEAAEPEVDKTLGGFEADRPWRVAKSLEVLRHQVNSMAPNRSKLSDGGIGDAKHATRNSDHNPWVIDGDTGVVTARDFTHDPANGCDAEVLAEKIRSSGDDRVKYIIWDRQIASSSPKDGQPAWAWRAYTGKNGHTHHIHISVDPDKSSYDSEKPWNL